MKMSHPDFEHKEGIVMHLIKDSKIAHVGAATQGRPYILPDLKK
jgi:hypothetical protein